MQKINLPNTIKKSILACGADTKGAFALAKDGCAYIYQGYSDLANVDNFRRYKKDIASAIKRLKIKPHIIACDLHPNYFSTNFAKEFSQLYTMHYTLYAIQHHKAHIASAIAENAIRGRVIGVAFDGTGYGEDGSIWGGEFFAGGLKNLNRVAHLDYVRMPGGESSIKNPWQMAVSYLYKAFGRNLNSLKLPFFKNIKKEDMNIIIKMIDKNFNCPQTSSMGRLFDAVSSLLGLVYKCGFEAEGPIKLQNLATEDTDDYYNFKVEKKNRHMINTDDIIKGIVKDISSKKEDSYISTKFHNTVARIILKVCKLYSAKTKTAVLSGGVFLNNVLVDKAGYLLKKHGFKVYTQSKDTTTDAGIPIGQIALSAF